ncbi:Protein phosphatase 1 regulatory subunit 12B [Fasciola gigantica]|uniref:Protein phosphatase 1 regulatory subunit 12B n=1 Tax=Fasciola gigantica TaxID=46835 RepID=A0A504YFU0_FASGI|nr:Protein phosphatase 1 regulatory subunit 12B [Fasciola gigantica]
MILKIPGVDLNCQDNDGWTALHAAAHWNREASIRLLAEAGASFDLYTPGYENQSVWENTLIAGLVVPFICLFPSVFRTPFFRQNQSVFDVADRQVVVLLRQLRERQRSVSFAFHNPLNLIFHTIYPFFCSIPILSGLHHPLMFIEKKVAPLPAAPTTATAVDQLPKSAEAIKRGHPFDSESSEDSKDSEESSENDEKESITANKKPALDSVITTPFAAAGDHSTNAGSTMNDALAALMNDHRPVVVDEKMAGVEEQSLSSSQSPITKKTAATAAAELPRTTFATPPLSSIPSLGSQTYTDTENGSAPVISKSKEKVIENSVKPRETPSPTPPSIDHSLKELTECNESHDAVVELNGMVKNREPFAVSEDKLSATTEVIAAKSVPPMVSRRPEDRLHDSHVRLRSPPARPTPTPQSPSPPPTPHKPTEITTSGTTITSVSADESESTAKAARIVTIRKRTSIDNSVSSEGDSTTASPTPITLTAVTVPTTVTTTTTVSSSTIPSSVALASAASAALLNRPESTRSSSPLSGDDLHENRRSENSQPQEQQQQSSDSPTDTSLRPRLDRPTVHITRTAAIRSPAAQSPVESDSVVRRRPTGDEAFSSGYGTDDVSRNHRGNRQSEAEERVKATSQTTPSSDNTYFPYRGISSRFPNTNEGPFYFIYAGLLSLPCFSSVSDSPFKGSRDRSFRDRLVEATEYLEREQLLNRRRAAQRQSASSPTSPSLNSPATPGNTIANSTGVTSTTDLGVKPIVPRIDTNPSEPDSQPSSRFLHFNDSSSSGSGSASTAPVSNSTDSTTSTGNGSSYTRSGNSSYGVSRSGNISGTTFISPQSQYGNAVATTDSRYGGDSRSTSRTDRSHPYQDTVDYRRLYEQEKINRERLQKQLDDTLRELSRVRIQLASLTQAESNNTSMGNSTVHNTTEELNRLREENMKMKEENGALIRVISKLSRPI